MLWMWLLDESRLFVHSIVVGRGKHRFPEGSKSRPRKLVEATTFRRSALYLTCQPADQ
jgi:dihydrofolate reductase